MAGCPSDRELDALATGAAPAQQRELLATHVAACPGCAAKVLPAFLRGSALGQTNFDSPHAPRRKISRELPTADAVTDPGTDVADTQLTQEKAAPHTAPPIGKGNTLDRYVLLNRLGAGGMGEVYAAWDPVLDRKVAVKILRAEHQDSPRVEELRLRLLREAQALARLSHPGVVTVHDVGLVGGQIFIAMEFVEGTTLTRWLAEKPRTWRQVLELFLAAGAGLAAAHAGGITHRDFKPDNLIVGRDGRVRVMDFGLAHARAEQARKPDEPGSISGSSGAMKRAITQPGIMLGTPAYMSPEALYGKATDFRSDVFSFCVALFEALYGTPPFAGSSAPALAAEIHEQRVVSPPRDTPVPRRIHHLLLKGLRANPDERFRTMDALLIQLGRRRSALRLRALAAGGLAVLLAAVGGTVLVMRRAQLRCAGVERRLDGVWDDATRAQAMAAFLATGKPWAQASWARSRLLLDTYGRRWVELRRSACESSATDADAALGLNIVCLSRRLADLQAVSQLFARADADVVERAVVTASALPPLEACAGAPPAARARSPEREDLRATAASARARLDAGRYKEALELAQGLAGKAQALADRGALAEARLLEAMARARLGDAPAADAMVEESILLAEASQDDELAARGWIERVGFAASTASADLADRWARHARAAVERAGAPLELQASLANNEGVLAWSRGQHAEAVAAHRRALELRTRLYGPEHPLVARSHANLGAALRALGRTGEALAQYREALRIDEAALDPSHPALAEALNNLGNALHDAGDLAGARQAQERALAIKQRAYGEGSLSAAVTMTNLGVLALEAGELTRAEELLRRSLEIKEGASGADAITVAVTLTNLAAVQRARKQWSEALATDTRALEIRRAKLGPKHPDLAWNLTGLGAALLASGRADGARRSLEEALALRTQPGEERGVTAALLAQAVAVSDPHRAKALLSQAQDELPPKHPLRAECTALESRLPLSPQRRGEGKGEGP